MADRVKEDSERFEVKGNLTKYIFNGKLLGEASSRRDDDSPRWTEIKIYKTDSGKYVVQKIGRSVLYHVPGSKCAHGLEYRANDPDRPQGIPCRTCSPEKPGDSDYEDDLDFTHETNFYAAIATDDHDKIRAFLLTNHKAEVMENFSSVCLELLRTVIAVDPSLQPVMRKTVTI